MKLNPLVLLSCICMAGGLCIALQFAAAGIETATLHDARLPPLGWPDATPQHPLGTDFQGRDILIMTARAVQLSAYISAASILLAATFGTLAGLGASIAPRWLDALFLRITELQLSLPALFSALLMHAVLGSGIDPITGRTLFGIESSKAVIVIAIAAGAWPEFALAIRSAARRQWQLGYVEAARAIGLSRIAILRQHIWPAVAPHMIALAAWSASRAIGIEATLSYLGIGLSPATPSLGRMIRDGEAGLLNGEWWIAGVPLAAVVVLTAGFYALGLRASASFEPDD